MAQQLTKILRDDCGVDAKYRHASKWSTPGENLELSGTTLKWYAVHPETEPVPEEITRFARAYLDGQPIEAKGLGFVILHRCGKDFYFLIVSTWRNNNELWETVFYKDGGAMSSLCAVSARSLPQADILRLGTCARLARERIVGAIPQDIAGRRSGANLVE